MKRKVRKKEENYIKKGGKGLKNASVWAQKLKKNFAGGIPKFTANLNSICFCIPQMHT